MSLRTAFAAVPAACNPSLESPDWTNDGRKRAYDLRARKDLRGGPFRDFVHCIRTGRKPLVTAETARRSLLVPMAAEKSIEEKRIVRVSELR